MEKEKKLPRVLFIGFILLFVSFLVLYISQLNGFYEYKERSKMEITHESMKRFEKDISEGKNIEVENYLSNTYKDYSTPFSKVGNKTSELLESFMSGGLKKTFKLLGALFT
ncbi:MAG: hypothetical protein RSB41_01275 [Bacilli bacterium]